jgi:hypothetical protein
VQAENSLSVARKKKKEESETTESYWQFALNYSDITRLDINQVRYNLMKQSLQEIKFGLWLDQSCIKIGSKTTQRKAKQI